MQLFSRIPQSHANSFGEKTYGDTIISKVCKQEVVVILLAWPDDYCHSTKICSEHILKKPTHQNDGKQGHPPCCWKRIVQMDSDLLLHVLCFLRSIVFSWSTCWDIMCFSMTLMWFGIETPCLTTFRLTRLILLALTFTCNMMAIIYSGKTGFYFVRSPQRAQVSSRIFRIVYFSCDTSLPYLLTSPFPHYIVLSQLLVGLGGLDYGNKNAPGTIPIGAEWACFTARFKSKHSSWWWVSGRLSVSASTEIHETAFKGHGAQRRMGKLFSWSLHLSHELDRKQALKGAILPAVRWIICQWQLPAWQQFNERHTGWGAQFSLQMLFCRTYHQVSLQVSGLGDDGIWSSCTKVSWPCFIVLPLNQRPAQQNSLFG